MDEKKKLPHSRLIYILAILSCLLFCFGGLSIILAIIAFSLAKKSEQIYKQNLEAYSNIKTIQKGKVMAIVGIVLNIIVIGITIWTLATIGRDAWSEEFLRRWNEGLQNNRP